jgi:hypothetical protein
MVISRWFATDTTLLLGTHEGADGLLSAPFTLAAASPYVVLIEHLSSCLRATRRAAESSHTSR